MKPSGHLSLSTSAASMLPHTSLRFFTFAELLVHICPFQILTLQPVLLLALSTSSHPQPHLYTPPTLFPITSPSLHSTNQEAVLMKPERRGNSVPDPLEPPQKCPPCGDGHCTIPSGPSSSEGPGAYWYTDKKPLGCSETTGRNYHFTPMMSSRRVWSCSQG